MNTDIILKLQKVDRWYRDVHELILSDLSEPWREAVVMVYRERRTYKETADLIGIGIDSVREHVSGFNIIARAALVLMRGKEAERFFAEAPTNPDFDLI